MNTEELKHEKNTVKIFGVCTLFLFALGVIVNQYSTLFSIVVWGFCFVYLIKTLNRYHKYYQKHDVAVSPVIGVILMVAITVAITATLYVYTQGMLDVPGTSITDSISCSLFNSELATHDATFLIINGNQLSKTGLIFQLLNNTGENCLTNYTYFDNDGDELITSGDAIQVRASEAGRYQFLISDVRGGLIYQSEVSL